MKIVLTWLLRDSFTSRCDRGINAIQRNFYYTKRILIFFSPPTLCLSISYDCREKDFDDILIDVARELTDDDQIEALGKALGVHPSDIQRCIQTNRRGPGVTSRGTLTMLRDWRQTMDKGRKGGYSGKLL